MAEIAAKGRLIVGMSADVLLFGFRNPFTGQLEGFDIDVLRRSREAIFGPGGEDQIEYRVINYAPAPPLARGSLRRPRGPHDDDQLRPVEPDRLLAHLLRCRPEGAGPSRRRGHGDRASSTPAGARMCVPDGLDQQQSIAAVHVARGRRGVPTSPTAWSCSRRAGSTRSSADDTVLAGFAAQDPTAGVVGDAVQRRALRRRRNAADVDLVRFVNGVLAQASAPTDVGRDSTPRGCPTPST